MLRKEDQTVQTSLSCENFRNPLVNRRDCGTQTDPFKRVLTTKTVNKFRDGNVDTKIVSKEKACPLGTFGKECSDVCHPGYYGLLCTEMCNCSVTVCDKTADGQQHRESHNEDGVLIPSKAPIILGFLILICLYRRCPKCKFGNSVDTQTFQPEIHGTARNNYDDIASVMKTAESSASNCSKLNEAYKILKQDGQNV